MLDLNVPPIENRDVEGTSNLHGTQHVQANEQGQHVTPTAIDVEALDDDVIESSARAFAEVCALVLSVKSAFIIIFLFLDCLSCDRAKFLILFSSHVRLKAMPEGIVAELL